MYAKLVEVQQQVLHLTKVVQKLVLAPGGSKDLGSHTLAGVILPLSTPRAVADVERRLLNAATHTQLVRS